ncbi:MAG: hypothetical protein R3A10_23050 [Caldilineaceae bacterium]
MLIRDDDVAKLVFNLVAINALEGTQTSYSIALNSWPTGNVNVTQRQRRGGECRRDDADLHTGELNVAQTVTVTLPTTTT